MWERRNVDIVHNYIGTYISLNKIEFSISSNLLWDWCFVIWNHVYGYYWTTIMIAIAILIFQLIQLIQANCLFWICSSEIERRIYLMLIGEISAAKYDFNSNEAKSIRHCQKKLVCCYLIMRNYTKLLFRNDKVSSSLYYLEMRFIDENILLEIYLSFWLLFLVWKKNCWRHNIKTANIW